MKWRNYTPESLLYRPKEIYQRRIRVAEPPIIIASSEDVGTPRALANDFRALLHYYEEEEQLKKAGAPIFAMGDI